MERENPLETILLSVKFLPEEQEFLGLSRAIPLEVEEVLPLEARSEERREVTEAEGSPGFAFGLLDWI